MKINPFRWSVFFGVLMLISSIVLLLFNPKPQNNLPDGFHTPIIAFEFIKTPQEVKHFFQVSDLDTYMYKFDMVNKLDFIFMACYAMFLASMAWTFYKITGFWSMLIAAALSLVAWPADALENMQIAKIAAHYQQGDIQEYLHYLNIFTWLKWGALAGAFLIMSNYFYKKGIFNILAALVMTATFVLAMIAFWQRSFINELMSNFVVLSFLMLFIYAIFYKKLEKP